MIGVNIEKARAIAARLAATVADQARRAALLADIEQAQTLPELAALVEQIRAGQ